MTSLGKTIMIGVAVASMLAFIATSTQGQGVPVPAAGVGESRGVTVFRAKLICTDCSLNEVRRTQPDLLKLIDLRHNDGQVVAQMTWINEGSVWSHIMVRRTWVRALPSLFEQLTSEENMFKEVEVMGVFNRARTLDMAIVEISPTDEPIGGASFTSPSSLSE